MKRGAPTKKVKLTFIRLPRLGNWHSCGEIKLGILLVAAEKAVCDMARITGQHETWSG